MKHTPIAVAIALALAAGPLGAQSGKQEKSHQAAHGMHQPTKQSVIQIISNWEKTPRFAAHMAMQKYGPPAEATPTHLVWFDNGPWKRTVISNAPTNHDFPLPHQDVMEQTIAYQVPPDKFDELAAYDGSVYVDRTRGEMSARCDLEPANFIALNLAHDIITGKRSVEEAREQYADLVIKKMTTKEAVPYAEKLAFEPPKSAGFSDKTTISQEVLQKVKQQKQAMMDKVLGGAGAGGTAKEDSGK